MDAHLLQIAKHPTSLSDREKAILAVAMEYLKRDHDIDAVDKTMVIQVDTRTMKNWLHDWSGMDLIGLILASAIPQNF